MKKIALTLLSVATMALCACSGSAVGKEEFVAKAAEIEDHEYSEAKVKYSVTMKGKSIDFEEFLTGALTGGNLTLKPKDYNEKIEGELAYTYNAETQEWTLQSEDKDGMADELGSIFVNLKLSARSIGADETQGLDESEGVEGEVKYSYYVNPFKVVVKSNAKADMPNYGITGKSEAEETMAWDKYGFLTSDSGSSKSVMSLDVEKLKESLGAGASLIKIEDESGLKNMTLNTTSKVTVSYK